MKVKYSSAPHHVCVVISIAATFGASLSACGTAAEPESGNESATANLECDEPNAGWVSGGHDASNSRFASDEHELSPSNANRLIQKWVYAAGGEVTATPAVDRDGIYFPDLSGNLSKVARSDGHLIWKVALPPITGGTVAPGAFVQAQSRSTPALAGNRLVIGTRDGFLLAFDTRTGALLWKTRADPHPAAMVTASPLIVGKRVYVGVASAEEAFTLAPGYACCDFRGSALALNLDTGEIVWRAYTVPEGYSGGAIWSGTPAYDPRRDSVYFTTGNNYAVPPQVQACVDAAGSNAATVSACLDPHDYFDSVIAIDAHSGKLKWGRRVQGYDAWILTCGLPEFNFPPSGDCPSPDSPDFDFGSGANLFTIRTRHGERRDLVGAGQKSGIYWAFDADTGRVVWSTQVGPGGGGGGIMWGSASDGERIYVANSKSFDASNKAVPTGTWTALDPVDGKVLWRTSNPTGARSVGFVSAANGVVFAPSFDAAGHFYAIDAKNGNVLWDFTSGGTSISGAAIVSGEVYWGSGYSAQGGSFNDKLYAFALPGHSH